MVLDLRGLDADGGPVTCYLRVVDVPANYLVLGEDWPPNSLAKLGQQLRRALGEDRGLGGRSEGHGVDQVQEVFVGEGGRTGEVENARVFVHGE
jgi:hypothetical protein